MPAHPVPRRADAVFGQLRVILPRQQVVAGGGDHVEPPAGHVAVGRAFEPAQEEGLEEGLKRGLMRDHAKLRGRGGGPGRA